MINRTLKTILYEIERDIILDVLREEGWNQTNTAKKLGVSRAMLCYKLKKYTLEGKKASLSLLGDISEEVDK